MADDLKVRIFTAEIIYHLFHQFSSYMKGKILVYVYVCMSCVYMFCIYVSMVVLYPNCNMYDVYLNILIFILYEYIHYTLLTD